MLSLAIRWLLLAFAVWVAAEVIPGIRLEGWQDTLFVALILGLINVFIRPILFFATLPATLLTLGLFLIVVNAALLELTAWLAGLFGSPDFAIESFGDALLGALIISLVGFVLRRVVNAGRLARRFSGSSW